MNTDINICIIGAGVIGLAIARELSAYYKDIFILEKSSKFGQGISSRNSEVIHSGIYYPETSLKAKLCLEGNDMLYNYCREKDIPFNNCGKLIVATREDELFRLKELKAQGESNGVKNMALMDENELHKMEPFIAAKYALHVPSTGIIDSHRLMENLLLDASQQNCSITYLSEVVGIKFQDGRFTVSVRESTTKSFHFTANMVINCAGLDASRVASLAGIKEDSYQSYFCKGEYFRVKVKEKKTISRLIYPLPSENLESLGIHATLELDGGVKLGPNTIFLPENEYNYSVNPKHQEGFYRAAKRYLPFLELNDIRPEMAGIRPKLQAEGATFSDFIIREESERGFPGLIQLIGIESPGLTASLSIAQYVRKLIEKTKK